MIPSRKSQKINISLMFTNIDYHTNFVYVCYICSTFVICYKHANITKPSMYFVGKFREKEKLTNVYFFIWYKKLQVQQLCVLIQTK